MQLIKTIIHRYPYLLVLLLALILRIWGLGLNPVGLAHDEIHDIINAKSIALTAKQAPGTVIGVLTNNGYCNGNCVFGELGTVILVPLMKFLPMDLFWVKIPFVVAALFIVLLAGKLMENLTNNRQIGILTSLLISVNPWAIHFGRTAYENLFAYALFFGSLYLWTKNKSGNKDAFWASLLGFLASLAYFGAKVVWPPLMFLGIIYWKFKSNHSYKISFLWLLLTLLFVVGYGILLNNSVAGVRNKELNWINSETTETVNKERKQSLQMPLGMEKVISNKLTVVMTNIGHKYLDIFSFKYFLTNSESSYDNFSIPGHGYLYFVEVVLSIIGFVLLFELTKSGWLFIMGLLLVIPIPGALNTNAVTFALRDGMIFPIISALGAIGWWYLLKIKRFGKIFGALIPFLLIISLLYFQILYWYRMPFEKSASYVFHERAMVNYVNLLMQNSDNNIEITVNEPVDVMYNFSFYTGKYNSYNWANEMNNSLKKYPYKIDKLTISKDCPKIIDNNTIYIWEREKGCADEPNMLTRISEPRDGGARFFILTDMLCDNEKLQSYPFPRKISDFNIEKMNIKDFCTKWISKL